MKWNMRDIDLPSLSPLRYRARLCESAEPSPVVLVLSFEGSVPDGSEGNFHSGFMASITRIFLALQPADCVVFDFRSLSYRFGDSLMAPQTVVMVEGGNAPIAYVVSGLCRKGLETLLEASGVEPAAPLFEELDAALDWASRLPG